MTTLKLYANLVSQPSRAVAWLLKIKNVDHEFIVVDRTTDIAQSEAFLKLNPNGFVPVIVDGDFVLFESNAILTYLAEKYGWDDLYPKDDIQARAKINEYLHWHHTAVRNFTIKIVRPLARRAFGAATPEDHEFIKQIDETIEKNTALVEKFLVKDYVANSDAPTLADFALYCEYDQLEAIGLLNLEKFPKTAAWLARMKQQPLHDEIHVQMNGFIKAANLNGGAAESAK